MGILVKDLELNYRSRGRRNKLHDFQALKDVGLEVHDGEFLSLVGPSGCGKSTFLFLLAGLIRKTNGCVEIDGEPIDGPGLDRGILMQQYALFPWRTVQKNVEFCLEIKGVRREERSVIAARFIDLVGLRAFSHAYPNALSGGMKQRIAIARALAYDPKILLMDEPFAAVDEQTREFLHEEVLRIWKATKKTIVFVTHSIDEAVYLSDRIAVMSGSPGQVKEVIDVDLPRPRLKGITKSTPEFAAIRLKVWNILQEAGGSSGLKLEELIEDSAGL
ncbi:MAG: ABC transporter ATP-binding protein [Coriobacteriaceae bacterium]|jgi:NitT/TauT family transport system ATP-binding protein|nr:ABC transporter ATP-binding protein [Coriobacteriaceae bacterium]